MKKTTALGGFQVRMLHFGHAFAVSARPFGAPLTSLYLSLAARAGVGHIGHNGDVAEWLKAAVC